MENEIEINMTDEEIKKELRRRKNRKILRRNLIIICLAAAVAVAGGIALGNKLGADKYEKEVAIKAVIAEDTPLINTALGELGNKGGDKFWKWFGFGSYQPWCACYVSWCFDQLGYIKDDKAIQFAMVKDGANWFKRKEQWLKAGETPVANDLIFFDWENDGVLDHVGIVTGVVGDNVYTVEGNSSDRCRQKRYKLSDSVIAGYGHMDV